MTFLLYCYIAIGSVFTAFTGVLCSVSMLGIMQQSGYSGTVFTRWFFRRRNMLFRRYAILALALLLSVTLVGFTFSFLGYGWANLISAVPFFGFGLFFYFASKRALKVPVKRTGRVMRLAACYFVLLFALCFGASVGFSFAAFAIGTELACLLRYLPVTLVPLFYPLLLVCANFLAKAYEVPRNRSFIKRAARTLESSGCVKVGITGSFAKTSVKRFAEAILSERFRVIATPASYNTPIGIARTVNESGADCDIFLAEMGARRTGDIKELCEMVKPEYGVITGVCPQHLETFGSIEAIRREKATLAAYANKGCVLGESAAELAEGFAAGREFEAFDVVCTEHGTEFSLRLGGETISVSTPLLGRHTAEDIALAGALCFLLGMSAEEIKAGIAKIQPVPHRLQKVEGNGLNILDDSYNSNVEGAKDAVYVLRLFGGKRYVVTPGLVELGQIEEEANAALGALFVGLDGVILVGETLVLAVREGYLNAGGEAAKLRVVPTLAQAQKILAEELTAGDSVLFLNDLPDIYN